MAKVKVLTREELCEIKKRKAQKRAKSWLVDSRGICTHIPNDKALVPFEKQKKIKEKELEKIKEEEHGLFAMFLPIILLIIIAGIIN